MRVLLLIFAMFLTGCSDTGPSGKSVLSPEQVSLGFFSAIYIERDVEKAKPFVDTPLQKLLTHYHLATQVQRHMLSLSMTEVTLEVHEIDIDFFRKFTDDITVKVKLKGKRGDKPWVDDRTIRLHKRNKQWIIVEILKEKFATNG